MNSKNILKAYFGDRLIHNNELFILEEVGKDLHLEININRPTSLIIYDINTTPYYIHYCELGLKNGIIHSGNVIVDYIKPNPPTGIHNYIINLYDGIPKIHNINEYIINNSGIILYSLLFRVSATIPTEYGKSTLTKQHSVHHPRYEHNFENLLNPQLSETNKVWCSCVLDVMEKNSDSINRTKDWGVGRPGL